MSAWAALTAAAAGTPARVPAAWYAVASLPPMWRMTRSEAAILVPEAAKLAISWLKPGNEATVTLVVPVVAPPIA